MDKKLILHLCADIGSDSYYYSIDENYEVLRVGKDIGVENFKTDKKVYGIIANPPCTDFSIASGFGQKRDTKEAMNLVNCCLKIIDETSPKFWIIENPATGRLKEFLGKPKYIYHPWQYGDPWTKLTSLWGSFNIPQPLYNNWDDVPKNESLYIRPKRKKPSLAIMHKAAANKIESFKKFIPFLEKDSDLRSLCSQGFAEAFYNSNK